MFATQIPNPNGADGSKVDQGLNRYSTCTPSGGTLAVDMSGAPYQSCALGANSSTTVTVANMKAPVTGATIQVVSLRLDVPSGSAALSWDAMAFFSAAPPTVIPAGKDLLVSFASYGEAVSSVAAVAAAQV